MFFSKVVEIYLFTTFQKVYWPFHCSFIILFVTFGLSLSHFWFILTFQQSLNELCNVCLFISSLTYFLTIFMNKEFNPTKERNYVIPSSTPSKWLKQAKHNFRSRTFPSTIDTTMTNPYLRYFLYLAAFPSPVLGLLHNVEFCSSMMSS